IVFTYKFIQFFFSSRRRHTRFSRDWSSDVCSSDLTWCWLGACAPARPTRRCKSYPEYLRVAHRQVVTHTHRQLGGKQVLAHRGPFPCWGIATLARET